ncbi:MAG: hypothetical protein WCD28_04680, partial [Nitrososphaeraceae archaeon]
MFVKLRSIKIIVLKCPTIRLVIKLDLSRVPTNLKSIIVNQTKSTEQVRPEPHEPDVVILQVENESENDIGDVKRKIKDLL